MSLKALVTGGAGFIGSHIAEAAVAAGHEVTVLDSLDRRVHPKGPRIPEGVSFVHGDILDRDALETAVQDVDVVFHEAAMVGLGRGALDAESYVQTNVVGTVRLLEAAARHRPRIVLASSMAIYGEGAYRCPSCATPRRGARKASDLEAGRWDPLCSCGTVLDPVAVTEDHPAQPETVYAISKWDQERMASTLGAERGLDVVALRYHNVYGAHMPRDTPYAGVAALFRSKVLAGEPPLVHEDGTQLRDFIRVEDVAEANLLAATAPSDRVAGQAFQIGTGAPRPIMDLAAELARHADPPLEPRLSGSYRAGDARHVFASVEKARRVLGFEARIGFEEGVRRFLDEPARDPPEGTP